MEYVCTKIGVDSLSRFSFRVRTHTDKHKVTDASNHPIHALATSDVSNYK